MIRPSAVLTSRFPRGLPLAKDAVRGVFAKAFGPAPIDPAADPGDPGLFGPGSASWKVIAEPAAIVGGIRALTVQLMHPGAMAGVADHSDYSGDALGRLQRTAAYVGASTFGSVREVLYVARLVRGLHVKVRGTRPDGLPYSADDPHLLAWVQIALTSSFLATDSAYAPEPISEAEADAFVAEQSFAAALLDPRVDLDTLDPDDLRSRSVSLPMLSDGSLPRSRGELDAAVARYLPELELNHQSRRTLRFLMWPNIPLALRAGYLPLFAGGVATIPSELRAILGLPVNAVGDAAVRTQVRFLLTGLRLMAGPSGTLEAARERLST